MPITDKSSSSKKIKAKQPAHQPPLDLRDMPEISDEIAATMIRGPYSAAKDRLKARREEYRARK